MAAGSGGSVSLSPGDSGSFHAANSTVTFTATPSTGYCFASWTGLNAGAPATVAVTVTGPLSTTANFTPCGGGNCASMGLGGVYAGSGATTVSVPVNASAGCAWTVSASSSWMSFPAGASGSGSGTLTLNVAQNQTGSFRIGLIYLGSDLLVVLQSN